MRRLNIASNQAGDTIVEVMIVLAILGLAIGISYATANRSLLATRAADLSAQASSLLQSQVESLRAVVAAYAANPNDPSQPNPEAASQPYCVASDGSLPPSTDASCNINGYAIQITYSAAGNDLYTLEATWPDIQGQGNDRATLYYRIHT